jgi:hypothetical protein
VDTERQKWKKGGYRATNNMDTERQSHGPKVGRSDKNSNDFTYSNHPVTPAIIELPLSHTGHN